MKVWRWVCGLFGHGKFHYVPGRKSGYDRHRKEVVARPGYFQCGTCGHKMAI